MIAEAAMLGGPSIAIMIAKYGICGRCQAKPAEDAYIMIFVKTGLKSDEIAGYANQIRFLCQAYVDCMLNHFHGHEV